MTRLFAGIGLSLLVGGSAAGAAEPASPMRTLVYSVTSSSHCAGRFNGDEHATLRIAVVGRPTPDSLLTDVTYTADNVTQPATRVAIFTDGTLGFQTFLCRQAAWVLSPLAVGLVGSPQFAPGQSWHVNAFNATPRGDAWYRVDSDDRAVIAINDWRGARDGRPLQGTMTYATDAAVPVSVTVEGSSGYVEARLVSDTTPNSPTPAR